MHPRTVLENWDGEVVGGHGRQEQSEVRVGAPQTAFTRSLRHRERVNQLLELAHPRLRQMAVLQQYPATALHGSLHELHKFSSKLVQVRIIVRTVPDEKENKGNRMHCDEQAPEGVRLPHSLNGS